MHAIHEKVNWFKAFFGDIISFDEIYGTNALLEAIELVEKVHGKFFLNSICP